MSGLQTLLEDALAMLLMAIWYSKKEAYMGVDESLL